MEAINLNVVWVSSTCLPIIQSHLHLLLEGKEEDTAYKDMCIRNLGVLSRFKNNIIFIIELWMHIKNIIKYIGIILGQNIIKSRYIILTNFKRVNI